MKGGKLILATIVAFALSYINIQVHAQDNDSQEPWNPTGEWPFVNKRFMPATVYTGFINIKKTIVPCNIHIGSQRLWYVQNDTMMEAYPGTILRIEFKDATFIPVNGMFGKIIHEDEIGKVIHVLTVNEEELDRNKNDIRNMSDFTLDGGGLFNSVSIDMIGSYNPSPEKDPVPTKDVFYFIKDDDLFEVTERNILNHLNKEKRKQYLSFTRSAEILLRNKSSVMKVWNTFSKDFSKDNKK